jgi:DnaJ-class molecular chaperone
MSYRPCKVCNELGTIDGEDCKECNGTGLAYQEEADYSVLEQESTLAMFDPTQEEMF